MKKFNMVWIHALAGIILAGSLTYNFLPEDKKEEVKKGIKSLCKKECLDVFE